MKANWKRLIIILVVVAVAAYFIWQNKKEEGTDSGSTDNGGSSNSGSGNSNSGSSKKDSTEAIIASLTGVAGSHKDYLRMYCARFESDPETKASLQAKADANGVTYAQQAVMDASYLIYYTNETGLWKPKADWAEYYHTELVKQVKAIS